MPFESGISAHTKLQTFVHIPRSSFSYWVEAITNNNLKWLEALVFLAVIIAAERHKGALKSQISDYIAIDSITLSKYLKNLVGRKLVFQYLELEKQALKDKELFDYHRPPVGSPSTESFVKSVDVHPSEAWFSQIDPLQSFNELDWFAYVPWKPLDYKNPLVQVLGPDIEVHERSLEATILMVSLLSRAQLRGWLQVAHGSHYRKIFATIKKRINSIITDMLTLPSIHHLHYRQIRNALPIMMYAARRQFSIDIARTNVLAKITCEEIRFAWDEALISFVATYYQVRSFGPQQLSMLGWDFKYFLTCFLRANPFLHWNAKYPDELPKLPLKDNGFMVRKPEWVEITEKVFSLKFLKNISQRTHIGPEIYRIIQLFYHRRILRKLKKNTYLKGSNSPRALTQTFDNASHRMYMSVAPRQSIPKSIRSIFKSKPKYQFLIVDIVQNDLSLWNALAEENDKALSDPGSNHDFTQVSETLNLPRESIKQATYSFFYGAGQARILLESGFSKDQWLRVKKAMGFTRFASLKRDIINHAKTKGTTPPTPHLHYRIPINKKYYRAPSLYVQAIGAEIMREWILNLREKNLAPFIVNLIHDEIIFELPQENNLEKCVGDIETCLHEATNAILPSARLRIRASAAKRWDEDCAAVIRF